MTVAFSTSRILEPAESGWPEVLSLYEYWRRRRAGRFAPARRDIVLMDLPPAQIPYLTVVDRTGDTFLYRYWGSGHARDYTDRTVDEIAPAEIGGALQEEYLEVTRRRAPLVFEKLFAGNVQTSLTLRMPLSNDGAEVDGVISYSARREMASALRDANGAGGGTQL